MRVCRRHQDPGRSPHFLTPPPVKELASRSTWSSEGFWFRPDARLVAESGSTGFVGLIRRRRYLLSVRRRFRMSVLSDLDAAGRRRSPATMPGYHAGRPPRDGRARSPAAVRTEFRRLAARAGVRRRFAPHQLRHAQAPELAREGVPLNIISAPARACGSRHRPDLPPGHPPRGDHHRRARAPRTDDVRQRRTQALT
jgi:Phage integrase family